MDGVFNKGFIKDLKASVYDEVMRDVPKTPRIYNGKDAAKYLGVSFATLKQYVDDGHIKPMMFYNNSRKLYDIKDLDKFIEMTKEGMI